MMSLLRSELYKMKHGKTLPVLCLSVLAVSVLSAIVTHVTSSVPGVNGHNAAFYAPIDSMYLLIVVAILSAEVIIGDYTQGIMRNMLISDKKRSYVFLAKFLSLFIETILFILFSMAAYTIVYTIVFGWNDPFKVKGIIPILRCFILLVLFIPFIVSFVTTIAIAFRNAIAVIGLCAGLAVFEIIILNILGSLSGTSVFILFFPRSLSYIILQINSNIHDIIRALATGTVLLIPVSIVGLLLFRCQEIK